MGDEEDDLQGSSMSLKFFFVSSFESVTERKRSGTDRSLGWLFAGSGTWRMASGVSAYGWKGDRNSIGRQVLGSASSLPSLP